MTKIGLQIYEYRKQHDLSQRELADIVGINRSYLAEIENGRRIPGREAAFKIARLFKENL